MDDLTIVRCQGGCGKRVIAPEKWCASCWPPDEPKTADQIAREMQRAIDRWRNTDSLSEKVAALADISHFTSVLEHMQHDNINPS